MIVAARKKWLFVVFILITFFLLLLIDFLTQKVEDETLHKVSDQISAILHKNLEQEKYNALRFALVLAHNSELIEALDNDDEELGYTILSDIQASIKKHTNTLVRAQVITAERTIFARSWDNSFSGMPIDIYRPDLHYFQKNTKPRAAIEVGRRLGFKATVPMYKNKEILGFVEVLQFFEGPTQFFRNAGIDFFVLMDQRFLDIAIFMQNNPVVGEYIVANRLHNSSHLRALSKIDLELLFQKKVLKYKDDYYFMQMMTNGQGEKIGAFVMVLQSDFLDRYNDEKGLRFLIDFTKDDLYKIVKEGNINETLFKSTYDKELMSIKDLVSNEDKSLYRQEAYDLLNEYSKEELINLLLNYNYQRKIRGEIQ